MINCYLHARIESVINFHFHFHANFHTTHKTGWRTKRSLSNHWWVNYGFSWFLFCQQIIVAVERWFSLSWWFIHNVVFGLKYSGFSRLCNNMVFPCVALHSNSFPYRTFLPHRTTETNIVIEMIHCSEFCY